MKEWTEIILGPNFRTSVSGLISAIGLAGMQFAPETLKWKWIFGIMASVGTAGLALQAKDRQTHSTFSEMEKATEKNDEKKLGSK